MRDAAALRQQIIRRFPRLAGPFEITGPPSRKYNCVALALGHDRQWWSHEEPHRWSGTDRSGTVGALVGVLAAHGFQVVGEEEEPKGPGTRLAVYARDGLWTHVAVRKTGPGWLSKLGSNALISHPDPRDLEGDYYGSVECFMARRNAGADRTRQPPTDTIPRHQ